MLSSLTMGDGIVVSPSTSHITNNQVITCGELWWSTNLSTCLRNPSGLLHLAIIITTQSMVWDVSFWVYLSIHGKKMTSSGPLTLSSGHCLRIKSFHDSPKRISYFLLPLGSTLLKIEHKISLYCLIMTAGFTISTNFPGLVKPRVFKTQDIEWRKISSWNLEWGTF